MPNTHWRKIGLFNDILPTLKSERVAMRSSSSRVAVEAAGAWVVVIWVEINSVSPGYPVSVFVSFTVIVTFLGPV